MTRRLTAFFTAAAIVLAGCATTAAEPDEPANQVEVDALGDPTGIPAP